MYKSVNNNIIRVGRNADDNDWIVKHSNPEWIWFHAKDIPSCHVVIETGMPTKPEIQQAAEYVRNGCKNKYVGVEYCPISNLKITNIPGLVYLRSPPKRVKKF